MKKEYTKPTIEGELFAANEYVAACYKVTCISQAGYGESMIVTYEPTSGKNGFAKYPIMGWYYDGDIAGYGNDDSWGGAHRVTISGDRTTDAHPNASA